MKEAYISFDQVKREQPASPALSAALLGSGGDRGGTSPAVSYAKISGVPCAALPTRYMAPVHIDVGGSIYTSTLDTLTKFPESRLGRMFNGSISIVLDTLKQHYFIDRDGQLFRHVLNYLRSGRLHLDVNFQELDQLLEEARFYDLQSMILDIEDLRRQRRRTGGNATSVPVNDIGAVTTSSLNNGDQPTAINMIHNLSTKQRFSPPAKMSSTSEWECVLVSISPELEERVSLTARRQLIAESFPELAAPILDHRQTNWSLDCDHAIRFPINGYCRLNSLQVIERLLNCGFTVLASTGGGVEGQQFAEYLLGKMLTSPSS